jgi:hypothetical protein
MCLPAGQERVIAVHEALSEAAIPHAIGGAIALGIYAEPRPIRDIDVNVFVPPERRPEVEEALAPLGTDGPPVHLFFSEDALHDAMPAAVREAPFAGTTIPIVSPEVLIIRKTLLDRPKDHPDIEALLGSATPIDLDEVDAWLERLGATGGRRVRRRRS